MRLTGRTYALTKIANELRDAIFAIYDGNKERALVILKNLRRNLAEFLRDGLFDDEMLLEELDKHIESLERGDDDLRDLEAFMAEVQRRLFQEISAEQSI